MRASPLATTISNISICVLKKGHCSNISSKVAALSEFNTSGDNLEEIFENREQIEISKHYEKMPKPTAIAMQELLDEKIYLRKPESLQ